MLESMQEMDKGTDNLLLLDIYGILYGMVHL